MPESPEPGRIDEPWTTLVLVCSACFERGDGPECGGNGGTIKTRLKEAMRDLKPGVRTVETSCLDCCPPKAFTVAIVSPQGAQTFALTSPGQTDEIVRMIRSR